ncbi:hypothetical protein [Burkholderia vietnamiensis]|uniref:hypothetical protein n=1 Tax=Burkholderia vietnamiensis TaxID=60552 RepID=UPI00075BD80D|nr:hypothetical protein [Burkholderia vietnamiensis]KVR93940.1 hypothetical protein WK27_29835 [Burkholderia vietnamiensis]UEC01237.1 hypothetical protein LK462_21995 [Burkholderia vietnamiensis]
MNSEKTIAEGLFELYATHQSERRDYYHSAQLFLVHLKEALRKAIGLPEHFEHNGKMYPWARLYKWDSATGDIYEVDSGYDVDTMNGHGELEGAIGIVLAHALNSFPKSTFYVVVRVRLTRTEFHVSIGPDRETSLTFARNATDFPQFYDAFLRLLEDTLKRSPYDISAESFVAKPGIGFI